MDYVPAPELDATIDGDVLAPAHHAVPESRLDRELLRSLMRWRFELIFVMRAGSGRARTTYQWSFDWTNARWDSSGWLSTPLKGPGGLTARLRVVEANDLVDVDARVLRQDGSLAAEMPPLRRRSQVRAIEFRLPQSLVDRGHDGGWHG